MKEQFFDLTFERMDDGTVRLEQRDNSGESYIVDAHPVQLIHIARILVGAKVTPEAKRIAILERRIRWLQERFLECHVALPSDMHERCAEAFEFDSWLQASVDVATEYCADLAPVDTTAHPTADEPH